MVIISPNLKIKRLTQRISLERPRHILASIDASPAEMRLLLLEVIRYPRRIIASILRLKAKFCGNYWCIR